MVKTTIEELVIPDGPKVLPQEQVCVYIPEVGPGKAGIAAYNQEDFDVIDKTVSISDKIKAKYQADQEARDQHLSDIDNTLSNHETAIEASDNKAEAAYRAVSNFTPVVGENARDIDVLYKTKASKVRILFDETVYKLTVQLLGDDDEVLSESQEIDLPLETVVVDAYYDNDNETLTLELNNGHTIEIRVSDIIRGLVSETSEANRLYATEASGNQTTVPYNKAASPNNVVQRTSMGNINLPETQENSSQAVRKSYVDNIGERAYYDHVITDEETLLLLNQFTGRILVKDVVLTQFAFSEGAILEANANATLIEFSNLTLGGFLGYVHFTVKGRSRCTLKNFSLNPSYNNITIDSFGIVEHCDTSGYDNGSIVNCGAVRDCRTSYIRNCEFVSDCHMYADNDAYLTNCKYVCGIYQEEGNLGGGTTVTCQNCQFVSNVNAEGVYQYCTYVDPNTCKGFIKDEDVNKIQLLKNDGTFQTADLPNTENFVQKDAFDNVVTQVGAIVDNHENRIATLEDGGGSGGGKLYEHRLRIQGTPDNWYNGFDVQLIVYRTTDTPLTVSDMNKVYTYPCAGHAYENDGQYVYMYGLCVGLDINKTVITVEGLTGMGQGGQVSAPKELCTISDTITEV